MPLSGQGVGTGSGAWGAVPTVPDPTQSAASAISGDLSNLPGLESLGAGINTFNTQQALAPYIANLPGYQGMVNQSSQNIGSLLQGQIPQDVMALLAQQSAERGVGQGLAGSPNVNASYLQGLGLTSLGLQQQGEQELTNAIQRTPVPQLFNVQSFLTSPADYQAAQMAANMYQAAPNPQMNAQALIDLFSRFMSAGGTRGGSSAVPSGGGSQNYGGSTPIPGEVVAYGPGGGPNVAPSPNRGVVSQGPTSAWGSFGGSLGAPVQSPASAGSNVSFGGGNPFASPSYQDTSVLGMGLDPTLNALFGTGNQAAASPGWESYFSSPGYSDSSALGVGLDPTLNALFGSQPGQYFDFNTGGTTSYQNPNPSYYDFMSGGQTPYQDPAQAGVQGQYAPFGYDDYGDPIP